MAVQTTIEPRGDLTLLAATLNNQLKGEAPARLTVAFAFPVTHNHGSARTTVLVVDDNPMSLELAAATLRGEGVSVLVARDGFQGISLLSSRSHDLALVIVDTQMPGMHGWEVIRFARTSDPAIRIVRLGRPDDEPPGAEYQAMQEVAVLERRFTPADLLATVRAQLPSFVRKNRRQRRSGIAVRSSLL